MRKVRMLIITIMISIGVMLIPMESHAEDAWSFDSATGTLYVKSDVIVSENGSGEYIAPWNAYKDEIKTVVLEETVNRVDYAFYGYEFDKIIIKNKDIYMKNALINTTVSIIDFCQDVSSNVSIVYVDRNMYYPTIEEKEVLTEYVTTYSQFYGQNPLVISNLGTDSDNITQYKASTWYIWGNEGAAMFPNQTRKVAGALAYSFYEIQQNSQGNVDYSLCGPDQRVVYDMGVQASQLEVPTGTTLDKDSLYLYVLGLGNGVSYWNYDLQNWVWENNTSISKNVWSEAEILSSLRNYIELDGKYAYKYDSYVLKDSYYLYTNYGVEEKCFVGKYIDGKIYYTYNGVNWEETNYTYSYEAELNESYSNDKGDIYPIYMVDDYLGIGSNFADSYIYKEEGVWYEIYAGMDQGDEIELEYVIESINIDEQKYDPSTGRYYAFENMLHLASRNSWYRSGGTEVTIYKEINGQLCVWNQVDWQDTGRTYQEYLNDGGSIRDVVNNLFSYNGEYFEGYYIFENNQWYYIDLDGSKTKILEVYSNENYLPLNYDQLTSASSLVIEEGNNVLEFEYYGLKTSVTVKGVGSSTTKPSNTPTAPGTTTNPDQTGNTDTTAGEPDPTEKTTDKTTKDTDDALDNEETDSTETGKKDTDEAGTNSEKEREEGVLTEEETLLASSDIKEEDGGRKEGKGTTAASFICTGIVLLLVIGLLLLLLLLKKKRIPFTYILDKEKKEMTITGYTGKDEKVTIQNSYRVLVYEYTVVEIAENAFNGLDEEGKENFNASITYVEIPNSVRKVGSKAFANCKKLEKVNILNKNCEIAKDAFDKNFG